MQSVDVITDCKFHIARLEVEIAQAQKRVLRGKPSSSWFLIFRFVFYVHCAPCCICGYSLIILY